MKKRWSKEQEIFPAPQKKNSLGKHKSYSFKNMYSPDHLNVHTFVFAAISSTFVSIVKR